MTLDLSKKNKTIRIVLKEGLNYHLFDKQITPSQIQSISKITNYWILHYPKSDLKCLAYILATADYETNRTFRPIVDKSKGKAERYGTMEKLNGNKYSKPIQLYYRRGILPMIWYENYQNISKKSGIDVLNFPEKLMDISISIQILVDGMMKGWFTGQKLEDYLSADKSNWTKARKVVCKSENAQIIKFLGISYYKALK